MPIYPLPQFEADLKVQLEEEDRLAYEALKAPKTLVVRFGSIKMIGEFPYDGTVKPGCGSKVVVRTFRGTELGEMLTSTCPNSGCSKSVSRQDMLKYIENSGGKDYPFFTDGRVLRIATKEDVDAQAKIEQSKHELRTRARAVVARLGSDLKIVEVEPILGGERLTAFYLSEHRLELRELARELTAEFRTRVEMRQVGARDEARLTADFEKCGQYCCCKNFLKVLKPVSMKAAKTQKATLEPLKISGRCGRLMCCLRYEEQTYDDLKARLPRKKSRVGTSEGDGTVVDGQILTQLVLVELDDLDPSGNIRRVAVAVEELSEPKNKTMPERPAFVPGGRPDGRRPMGAPGGGPGAGAGGGGGAPGGGSGGGARGGGERRGQPPRRDDRRDGPPRDGARREDRRDGQPSGDRRGPGPSRPPQAGGTPPPSKPEQGGDEVVFDEDGNEVGPGSTDRREGSGGPGDGRRRRRRRRRGGPGGGPGGGSAGGGGPAGGSGGGPSGPG